MGFLSWFSTTTSKSAAAVLIQSCLEGLARGGLLSASPAILANRMVEAAYERVPTLAKTNYNKHILAASILAMVPALSALSETEREAGKHALGLMLSQLQKLLLSNSLALTLSEQDLLEKAHRVFLTEMKRSSAINLGD